MTDAPAALSEQDLAAARAELAGGRAYPVWFTAAAVGVPVGGSAKIVSIGEPAEGDFVEVRPTGTKDTVFCSPNELTGTRPPRRRAKQAAPPARREAAAPQREASARESSARESSARESSARESSARESSARESSARESSARESSARESSARAVAAPPPAAEKPAQADVEKPVVEKRLPRARAAARPVEVTVTLNSTAEGEWTVEVTTGRKRSVRPTPVQPADVAKAARSLPSAVADAIESSLAAARQRQIERVERLRAELDAAQRALQDLSD